MSRVVILLAAIAMANHTRDPRISGPPAKRTEKSSLASEAVRKEGKMAHREAVFGHCLAANRWLGRRLTDFSDGFCRKAGE